MQQQKTPYQDNTLDFAPELTAQVRKNREIWEGPISNFINRLKKHYGLGFQFVEEVERCPKKIKFGIYIPRYTKPYSKYLPGEFSVDAKHWDRHLKISSQEEIFEILGTKDRTLVDTITGLEEEIATYIAANIER
jgi:hypothetical protein